MEVMSTNPNVPQGLVGKEDVIFGNIKEIYEFHQRLAKYHSKYHLFVKFVEISQAFRLMIMNIKDRVR